MNICLIHCLFGIVWIWMTDHHQVTTITLEYALEWSKETKEGWNWVGNIGTGVWSTDLLWVPALMVPMHLGLTDRPFVPHKLIPAQESPVPLPKFQIDLRLKILMSSGSKKGTQIHYPFLSKSPGKWTPSTFPNGAPMERDTCLQGIFTSLKGPKKRQAPRQTDALSRALFSISFGVSSNGALLHSPFKVPSIRAPPSRFQFLLGRKRSPLGERRPYPGPSLTYLPGSQ